MAEFHGLPIIGFMVVKRCMPEATPKGKARVFLVVRPPPAAGLTLTALAAQTSETLIVQEGVGVAPAAVEPPASWVDDAVVIHRCVPALAVSVRRSALSTPTTPNVSSPAPLLGAM